MIQQSLRLILSFFTKTAPLDLEETKTEIEEIEPEEEKDKRTNG